MELQNSNCGPVNSQDSFTEILQNGLENNGMHRIDRPATSSVVHVNVNKYIIDIHKRTYIELHKRTYLWSKSKKLLIQVGTVKQTNKKLLFAHTHTQMLVADQDDPHIWYIQY